MGYGRTGFVTLLLLATIASNAFAINGGTLRVTPRNSWRAFEVITIGDNPAGDGYSYAMPGNFDGIGAWIPAADTLRFNINQENSDANVSEVNLNLDNFQSAIHNMIGTGS